MRLTFTNAPLMKDIKMRKFYLIMFLLIIQAIWTAQVFPQSNSERKKRMLKNDGAPKAGDMAPLFKIKSLDGKSEFGLQDFRGQTPVVLFFGSYT
jgi:hypothetical protein